MFEIIDAKLKFVYDGLNVPKTLTYDHTMIHSKKFTDIEMNFQQDYSSNFAYKGNVILYRLDQLFILDVTFLTQIHHDMAEMGAIPHNRRIIVG